MSERYAAIGTLLKVGDGDTPENFTTVAAVSNFTGPSLGLDTVETTALDSAGAWKEYMATLLDAGEVSGTLFYDPAEGTHDDHTGLIALQANKTLRNFQIVFPDPALTTVTFAAFVTNFAPAPSTGDLLAASFTLRTTGQPNWS